MPTQEELRIANKVWDRVFGTTFDVASMSYQRKGTHYEVKRHSDGHWSCNCKSWIFQTGTCDVEWTKEDGEKVIIERTCKHCRFVMRQEKMDIRERYRR